MDSIIKQQIPLREGFNNKELLSYVETLYNVELPTFSLHAVSGGLEIDLQFDDFETASTIGSTLRANPSIHVDSKSLLNMVHNITVGHLADNTDFRFSSKFPLIGDGFDGHTPDLIIESAGGSFYVIEFTTTRGAERSALSAARNKIVKYEMACMNRAYGRSISLSVISVWRGGVISNLVLTDDDVNELVYRYRLSLSIFEEASQIYPEIRKDDEEMTKLEREIMGVVTSITMDWDRTEQAFPMFSRDIVEKHNESAADNEYISRIISKVVDKSLNDMRKSSFLEGDLSIEERFSCNFKECETSIGNYIANLNSREFVRDTYDSKSTVQIPPWVTSRFIPGKDLDPLKDRNIITQHPMGRIWYEVCQSANNELIERMHDDPERELSQALNGEMDRSDERSRYHRVKLELENSDVIYIASLGVGGKSLKDNRSCKEARERSKKLFRIDHDTADIDSFLRSKNDNILKGNPQLYNPFEVDRELRLAAQCIHQPTLTHEVGENEFLENHNRFLQTPVGSWSQMVSLIGAELSASVKQHVKPGSFVIKRILGSGVFLLIKPTSSVSHIFVSFAVLKDCLVSELCQSGVFKSSIDCGDLVVTDFVSFKMSKLTNLCKCCSLLECALAFWAEAYGHEVWNSVRAASACKTVAGRDMVFMFKLSLLTLMEDKATTEEMQTLTRYVIMEGFVSQPEIPKPHKMMSKLPCKLRSELQVYILNRVLNAILRISESPFKIRKTNGKISWTGLFNPYSGNPISELQILISSCYNGYFKNKEEETEPTALSAMYKKIIELEHLCPDSDEYLGRSDPESPRMHEFSRSYLKQCTDHAKHVLRSCHGPNVLELIHHQIIRDLGSLTLERLATLKATSNFDQSWYDYKDVKDKNYTRDKLIVKMSKFADKGNSLAIQMFEECMSLIEERGSMHICLFKKQQHGGLREIYVMGAEERIVQCVVESIAKSIGGFFPSDTLCNPANKSKIPESHGIRARKHCKGPVWTTATSDDARKWNQGHFVMKFAMMLCEFTHTMWWPIIIRGCSMFTRKYMMMNLKYLAVLDGHKDLKVEDEFVMTLFKAYHGEIEVPWIDKGKTFLKTKTGMMQGILHFTSSLLHTIHQEFVRSLTFKIFNMKVAPDASQNIVCDMMQGSDDSSMIISFPAKDSTSLARYKTAAALCFRIKKLLGIYLAIYPSEKSTSNTDFVMEYNSEFYFHSQHVRPTIRWIAACCSLPEVETLVARQEEASNLMTAVTEGGGSFSLACQVQQAQCTIHYMLMGMGVSQLFEHFKCAILEWLDPGLGFFLLDNPYAAGLGGFRFNLFKAIKETKLQKLYSFFLKRVRNSPCLEGEDDALISESCSVSPGGALILSSSLKWGSRQKFMKLRERLNIPDDWVEQINQNPEILYRAPRTGKEILLRIAEKVHSPGVVSSLSTGNAVCKVMASAVYFLSASIFEDTGRPEVNIMGSSKYSLLQKMVTYEGFKNSCNLTGEELLFLFPNAEELMNLDSLVFDRQKIDLVQRVSHRDATQTKIIIFDEYHSMRVSPEKLVSDKWFQMQKSKIGKKALDQEWDKLTSIVAWLRDNPDDTLKSSPLNNHVQIRNFFARMEGRARTVRVTGAPVKKRSGISKLSMVIRDNFSKVGYLRDIEDSGGLLRSQVSEIIKHYLFCILQGPYSDEMKRKLTFDVFYYSEELYIKESDRKTKANTIAIFQAYTRDSKDVVRMIEEVGAGIVGGFVRAQSTKMIEGKVYYYGIGIWRGVIDGVQVQIDLDNDVGKLPHITAVHIFGSVVPWEMCQGIRSWADDIRARNDIDVSTNKSLKPGYRYWMSGFKMFSHDKKFGCPVYVLREKMTSIVDVRPEKIYYKIRNKTINLYLKEGRGDLHILSYTSGDQDISPASLKFTSSLNDAMMNFFSKEPSKSWLHCTPLSYSVACRVLSLVDGSQRRDHIMQDSLARIIRMCTESSLRSRVGTVFSHLPAAEERERTFNLESMIDLMIEEMEDNCFDDITSSLAEDIDASYEDEGFDITDVDLFGPAHYREMSDSAFISHPLMDCFIEYIVERVKRRDIRKSLETCRVLRRNKDMMTNLFKALGRDENQIKLVDNESGDSDSFDDDLLG
ncbi:RNA-dependent RNA polymerase [Anhanga virus]|uniref:RNA-directed RNA polymerase L n=2 Tax=Anhanga virus TaxID=904722 RepID=A0A1S5SHU0_9VIRU|nr:RNA-dependent RNA polymerase [Anhanga virus]API68876.1 RNA-dependent RNA polymerase [Anhanga virus]